MPPLTRPRRRRWLLMNESSNGSPVAVPDDGASAHSVAPEESEVEMLDRFLFDCGLPEGFDVHVTVAGRPELKSIHIDAPFAFIGRDETCGIRLPGADIARHHAYIQAIDGQFFVVDLGSRTGLRSGGRSVRTVLVSGDEPLEIGPYTIRISGHSHHEFQQPADRVRVATPAIALGFVNQSKPVAPWTVDSPVTLLGSAKPSRIRLEHSSVTPQHCAMVRGGSTWWIVDLNSQAGTLVDGVRVHFAPLGIGTQLQIGRYQIAVQKPKPAEPVVKTAVVDDGHVHTPATAELAPANAISNSPIAALTQATPGAAGPVVNEHLVLELFKEFAALHERTINQVQQSFKEMLEVVTTANSRTAIAQQTHAALPSPDQPQIAPVELEPEPDDASITNLIQSEDPEERAAAQELLAAKMRSLQAQLSNQRDGIAKRLLRSLSLTK